MSATAQDAVGTLLDGPVTSSREVTWWRRALVVLAVGAVAAGQLVHAPALSIVAFVAVLTAALARRLPWDIALLVAVPVLLVVGEGLGLVAGLVHVPLLRLGGGWASSGGVVLVALLLATRVWRSDRRPRPASAACTGRVALLAYAPALLLVAVGLEQSWDTGAVTSWFFQHTDPSQHLLILQSLQQDGYLTADLAQGLGYPRAVHFAALLFDGPGSTTGDRSALFVGDLRLYGATLWLSLAFCLSGAATVTARMAQSLGGSRRVGALSAAAVALVILGDGHFVRAFFYAGAASSLVALAVLWLPLAVCLCWSGPTARHRRYRRHAVLLSAACLAGLWQPLAVIPLAGLALTTWGDEPALTRVSDWFSRATLARVAVLLAGVPVLGVVLWRVLALMLPVAISVASIRGLVAAPRPWQFLAVGLVVLAVAGPRWGEPWVRALVGSVVSAAVVVVVLAYLAAEGRGFDFAAYYPTKMMWFFVLMASPAVAATVGVLLGALLRRAPALGRTWRAFRAVPVLRFVWWPLVAVALVSVALPWAMAFPPDSAVAATGWSRFPESRVLLHLATDAPLPEGGRVLPLDMLLENSIPMPNARAALQQVALKLLWFRLGTNQADPYPSNSGDTGYVCSLIRSSSTPTAVVTARDPRTVRSDLAVAGCPGATVVGLSAG